MKIHHFLAALFITSVSPLLHADQFDDWDKNHDGKLSRDEFPEPLRKLFDVIDTNHDGFISREEDRAARERNRNRGPQPPRIPDSVKATMNISYADTDDNARRLDFFLPAIRANDKPLPVIVNIHGGAWKAGTKESTHGTIVPYVATGLYAGVCVEYRLSGEAKWPAQINDCKAAIRWIKAHAKEYNLDPDHIGVWGASAGGHLVSMLGVAGDVKELEGTVGKNLDQSSRIACVVDYFGPTNLLTMGDFPSKMDHNDARSPESELIGGAIQENKDKARNASPITYVTKDDAPVLIAHGTADPLVPYNQGETFAAALNKTGVPVYVETIDEGGHGGFDGPKLNERVKAFFEKYLRGVEGTIETGHLKVRE